MSRAVRLRCKVSGKLGDQLTRGPPGTQLSTNQPRPSRSDWLWRQTASELKAAQETRLFIFFLKKAKIWNEEKHFKLQKQGILESPGCLQT